MVDLQVFINFLTLILDTTFGKATDKRVPLLLFLVSFSRTANIRLVHVKGKREAKHKS